MRTDLQIVGCCKDNFLRDELQLIHTNYGFNTRLEWLWQSGFEGIDVEGFLKGRDGFPLSSVSTTEADFKAGSTELFDQLLERRTRVGFIQFGKGFAPFETKREDSVLDHLKHQASSSKDPRGLQQKALETCIQSCRESYLPSFNHVYPSISAPTYPSDVHQRTSNADSSSGILFTKLQLFERVVLFALITENLSKMVILPPLVRIDCITARY
ncbi:unnamed protein product [Taenia asiatica]|uniref:Xylose isomerase n=1 Tax=Taenia asiatica TaxID=60517 RepID=A0A0R3WFK9_TAEAS|nr:unnamed protein product [Taenia asiatica]